MIPRLEKSLTEIRGQRDQLVNRFGVVAIDVLRHANSKKTVAEIATELKVEQNKVEDVLAAAHKLGILEFKLKHS
jgi:DNA-binding transcriptional regulator LsrR (DeoR family)